MADWEKHEQFIAKLYGGERTKGSGNTSKEKGDVRIPGDDTLMECKYTKAGYTERVPRILSTMEKIAFQAYEEGMEPALAIRYFHPTSPLADNQGNVDLIIRLARDDAAWRLRDHAANSGQLHGPHDRP